MTVQVEGADEFVRKTLGDLYGNLQLIREKRKMSYRDLGIRAGLPERTVISVVKGQQGPSPVTLARIAKALVVPVSDLYIDHERFAELYAEASELPPFVLVALPLPPSNPPGGRSTGGGVRRHHVSPPEESIPVLLPCGWESSWGGVHPGSVALPRATRGAGG